MSPANCGKFIILSFLICSSIFISLKALAQQNTVQNKEFHRALQLFEEENFKASGAILQKLIKTNPQNGLYWFNLGNVYYSLQMYPQAIRCYSSATELTQSIKPLARLYKIKSHRKLGESQKALKELEELLLQDLPPSLEASAQQEYEILKYGKLTEKPDQAHLNAGIQSYKSGLYEEALESFRQSMKASASAEAKMMIGLTQLRLGQSQTALASFREALQLRPHPGIKAEAMDLIRQIRDNLWPQQKSWWLWMDLSAGSNSNYYELGKSDSPSSTSTGVASIGTGYRLVQSKPWFFQLGYMGSWQEAFKLSDSRYVIHTMQLPFGYQSRKGFFSLTPTYQYQYLGSTAFLSKQGGSFQAAKYSGPVGFGVNYEVLQNNALHNYFDYLTGDVTGGKIYIEYDQGKIYYSLFYSRFDENIGDLVYTDGTLPLGNLSQGPGISLSWQINSQWSFFVSGSYLQKKYYRNSQPGSIARKDQQTAVSAKITYNLSGLTQIYFSHELISNKSTLTANTVQDKNFDKSTSNLGFSWSPFP